MNYFDDERKIIRLLQETQRRKIRFVNPTLKVRKFFYSLYQEKEYANWKNSSGKDDIPPDFFSEKYKYMLEVMRVDDYELGDKSPNALESKIVKGIEDSRRLNGMPLMRDLNIDMFVIPDMSKASENNYKTYVENFKRIVNKHLDKIESYRNNHLRYKLGFLILDEAVGYIKPINSEVNMKPGERAVGCPHWHFRDKNLVEMFKDKDLDFVIWMTPYKNLPQNRAIYPEICIFDLKKLSKWRRRLIEYKFEEMVRLEVE